jgi:malate dehydrogenase (oxaloacetate-decarboxylating)/malate dehydrogenase (oxaloacetate-decarboxylating)(NADP+)
LKKRDFEELSDSERVVECKEIFEREAPISREEALCYHQFPKAGKLGVETTVKFESQRDLSLAYTPGVAEPCKVIEKNPNEAYHFTSKANLVAVISNGTAVLGLGDIGALASKPVMEGKAILFKNFSAVDSFDIEVNEKDIDKFCSVVEAISPTFGGINLEDIKAPECFEIEKRLVNSLDIPVMHDDQHGTAIITSAGIINACEITDRKLEDIKVVIVGAGAAAISSGRMYKELGISNIVMIDSKGVVHKGRKDLNSYKLEFALDDEVSKEDTFRDADMVLGLSKPKSFGLEHIAIMAKRPIVFSLANPVPEVFPEDVKKIRPDAIVATGRSDFPNQVNNVLGFPFIFRGALDVHAKAINMEMKKAASFALAKLAKEPVPEEISEKYDTALEFGENYIIPKPFDRRLIVEVSSAVAKSAFESGVARVEEFNYVEYRQTLLDMI